MTEPISSTFTDVDGDDLQFHTEKAPGMDPAVYVWTRNNGVRVTPADLPEVVAKMYAACGLVAPIILDRRLAVGSPVVGDGPSGITITPSPVAANDLGGTPGVLVAVPSMRLHGDEPYRLAAILIDAMEAAVAESEHARVSEIAQALRDANPSAEEWEAAGPHMPVEAMARNLLRRFTITEREPAAEVVS